MTSTLSHNGQVDLPGIAVCAFEEHAMDFDSLVWERLCQAPVRGVLDLFQEPGAAHAFNSPGSRKFTCMGKPAPPSSADCFSFLAKVDHSDLPAVLSCSGHNGVYCTPRSSDLSLSSEYAVVWIGSSRVECIRASMQVAEQRGLVFARGRYGLRVPAALHAKIHSQLRPGTAVPDRLAIKLIYRLGPLPRSAGAKEIQTWAGQLPWRIRPLKASGPTHWIIGSESEPPSVTLGWNGQAILATRVDSQPQPRSALESGKLPAAPSNPSSAPSSEAADPWLLSDPWKVGRTQAKPDKSAPMKPRLVQGPVEHRFQQQDGRLLALEQGLKEFREEHQAARSEDRAAAERGVKAVEAQVGNLAREFSDQMKASLQLMQDAQLRQQEQMQSSLDELKGLMLGSAGNARKQPRNGDAGHDL